MTFHSLPWQLLIAHRGYKAKYPENTMVAFKAALALGSPMIELDVTLTQDRKIVVIHDDTLERTTNGKGHVRNQPFDDLRKLDAGSWFSPEFIGEKLPSLDEVLTLCAGKILVNVEIKPEAHEEPMPEDGIEIQLLDKIRGYSMTDSVIISSFKMDVIRRIAGMKGEKPLLAMLSEDPIDDALLDFMVDCGVFSYNPDHTTLTKEQVDKAHHKGLRVFTYTVNTVDDAKRCFDMGVDGVFTDDPVLLRGVMK
ncbi:MAG: glycerophosphodiester phosphodiesterase family protein [Desulfobacteraceae bacterium]|jgi:glycerophosphoryl diester phosphodiesterase